VKPPEEIHNVRMRHFSIARLYGGITFNGVEYFYVPHEDKLIRTDIVKARVKAARDAAKAAKAKQIEAQGALDL